MAKRKKRSAKASKPQTRPQQGNLEQSIGELVQQHPDWVALGIFLFLMAIFFHELIFGNKIYFSPDLQAPSALQVALRHALWKEGIFPFWTPYIFAGMPSFASLIYTPLVYLPYIVFSTLNQLVSLPPLLPHIVHYPLAAMGVYLYLREFKVDYFASLLGGIAFMFTPYLVTMEVFGHGSQLMTAAYMPLALWSMERLLKNGNWLNIGITALILGLQFQRGHVQIVYYTWMVLGAYFFFHLYLAIRAGQTGRLPIMVGSFVLVSLVAFGLAAVLYLSIYEYMPYSIRGAASTLAGGATQKGVGFEYATQWSFSPAEMMTFLIPSFFGFGGRTYWGTMPFTDYPNYMGIIILALAVFTLTYRRTSIEIFLAVVILVALLISFGKHFALFYKFLYNVLPFFNRFRVPVMILVVVQMSVAILAGFGLHKLMLVLQNLKNIELRRSIAKRLFQTAAGLLIVMLILSLAKNGFFSLMQSLYPDQYPPDIQLQLDRQRFAMLFRDMWLISLLLSAGSALLALTVRNTLKTSTFAAAVLILSLADLWAVDFQLSKPTSRRQLDQYLAPDEVAKFLQADTTLYRIFPQGTLFGENRWAAQSIQSIGGYHAAKPRVYQDFLDATRLDQNYVMKYYRMVTQGGQRRLVPLDLSRVDSTMRRVHQNLIDFLNVKYLISPYPIPEPTLKLSAQVRQFIGNQPVILYIYENQRVLPRVQLVGAYELKAPRETLRLLNSEAFDPRTKVYLYQKPEPEPQPDSLARAEIVSYGLHHIDIRFSSTRPQLLVLSDTYYPPGWHATVDGRPVRILQANHAFRALAVPAGEHHIRFEYRSRSFFTGLWISVGSLALVVAFIVLGIREQRRQKK